MEIHKGDLVQIKARAEACYLYPTEILKPDMSFVHVPERKVSDEPSRCLVRFTYRVPILGIAIGKTYRATGLGALYYDSYGDRDVPYLDEDMRHWGWMIALCGNSDRYTKPVFCLEVDISPYVFREST